MNHKPMQRPPWNELAKMIGSIGRASFVNDCLAFINTQVRVDHLALFGFDRTLKPLFLGGASPPDKNIVAATGQQYIRSFYMSDPNLSYISQHRHDRPAPLMLRLKAEQISNPQYREHIYKRKGLLDRVSWIGITEGNWYSANLYRDNSSGYYRDEELALFREFGGTLCTALEQHTKIVTPNLSQADQQLSIAYLEKLVIELRGGLTGREVAVCARALSGMTRKGVALDLGIKPTTVATLTQRAYAKLNVSSLNELFALCLRALTLSGEGRLNPDEE